MVHILKYTEATLKQTSHTKLKPGKKKHPPGPLREMWDFSSFTEQTVSMIHRWLHELEGIHMAVKKDPNGDKHFITHLISTDLCIETFKQ